MKGENGEIKLEKATSITNITMLSMYLSKHICECVVPPAGGVLALI